jgi:DNA-binding NarL/FixJ family response regulator
MAAVARSDPSHRTHLVGGVVAYGSSAPHAEVSTKIRLTIASPVHLVRDALAAFLHCRDGFVVLDAVDLGPDGIAKITDAEPDAVLVDLGQTDSVATAWLVRAASPRAKLVAFALDETDDRVFACAAAGFSGYVPCESGADELCRALVDAVEGRIRCPAHRWGDVRPPRRLIARTRAATVAAIALPPRERDPGSRRTRPLQQGDRASAVD